MTKAQLRALEAVSEGLVTRHYHKSGNTLHGPSGISPIVLWKLDKMSWMRDGDKSGTPVHIRTVPQVLTTGGHAALEKEKANARKK